MPIYRGRSPGRYLRSCGGTRRLMAVGLAMQATGARLDRGGEHTARPYSHIIGRLP